MRPTAYETRADRRKSPPHMSFMVIKFHHLLAEYFGPPPGTLAYGQAEPGHNPFRLMG
jgi:hypothetical protein